MTATDDEILRALESDWQCACCGAWHHGLMHLSARVPGAWTGDEHYEPNASLRTDGDFLSEDFCVIDGTHFFVRGVLELPIRGLDQPWTFGCWSSLSAASFDAYVHSFDMPIDDREEGGCWFGWLSNGLPNYYVIPPFLSVDVEAQGDRQRPRFSVHDDEHPLGIAQRTGLSPLDLLNLLRACGHAPALQ